jgi:TonB family protein
MKRLYLTIIALLFFAGAHAQETAKSDSLVASLKIYLEKNLRPPAVAIENNVQGTVVIGFKIDDNKNITDIQVVKSLSRECDAEALRVFRGYRQPIPLSSAEYTAGITFLIENGKRKKKVIALDKSAYQNFLFEVNVISNFSY